MPKITKASSNLPAPLYDIPCCGACGSHPSFWKTVTTSPQWIAWEGEVASRFHAVVENIDAEKKVKDSLPTAWDVDECRECGFISPAHWADFMAFVAGGGAKALPPPAMDPEVENG